MGLLLRIFIGLVIAAIGVALVIKTRKFMDFFGSIPWADAKLGGGGSNLMYKLIGIAASFIGFMIMTNLWNVFLNATLGSLFGAGR